MSIVTESMTVNLQVGFWIGQRLDKEASRKVVEEAGATDSDAARVNKHIVPKETLKPIVTAANSLRAHFYAKTLPWKDNGDRLLTRKMFDTFVEEHGKLRKVFEDAVETFLRVDYPKARDQAEFRMGTMFKADDYPSIDSLRRRFYVALDIDAVTTAGDFRVQMEANQLARIQKDMEASLNARLGKAMTDIWERLAETLGHFQKKMDGDDIFRDSTVKNLEELVAMLPALNVTDDPELARICSQIEDRIIGYTPKELRTDKHVRTLAATEAKKIMDDMAGFMRAFGSAA